MPDHVERGDILANHLEDHEEGHRHERARNPPKPAPKDHGEEHGNGVQLQPTPHKVGGDELPLDPGEDLIADGGKDRIADAVECGDGIGPHQHRADHPADIGQEVQQERRQAPDIRNGQPKREKVKPNRDAKPRVDDGDGQQVARHAALNVIDRL